MAMLALGSPEARFIALKTGNVHPAVLPEGFKFVADEAGLHELVSFLNEDVFLLSGSVGDRENLIKSDRSLVEKFLRGTIKGLLYAQSNRSAVLPYVVRTLKVKEAMPRKSLICRCPVLPAADTSMRTFKGKRTARRSIVSQSRNPRR